MVARMIARKVLIGLEGVVDDGAEGGPAGQRGRAGAERVVAGADMGEIAAGARAGFIDQTEVAIQENAAVLRTAQDSESGRVGVGNRIKAGDGFRSDGEIAGDLCDFWRAHGDHGVTAAIGACGAIHMLPHFGSENLKRLLRKMMGGEVAAEVEVLPGFGGSEPEDFGQVGNHALSILPGCGEGKATALG